MAAEQRGSIRATIVAHQEVHGDIRQTVLKGEDGVVTLQAENPAYPPMVFTGEDVSKVRVLGLATHFISVVR